MDKNFLGLGITFSAIDDGLTKVAGKVSGALNSAGKAIDDTNKSAKAGGGFLSGIQDGLRNLSIAKISNDLSSLKDHLSGNHSGFNDAAVQIDSMRAKLGAALNPKVAGQFSGKLMGVMHDFALSGDQTEIIANNLINAGRSLGDMQKSLPMIGSMVGVLGMDAEQVSHMFSTTMGTMNMTADETGNLSKEIFKLQKDYNLTDQMSALPEITENVYKNLIKLGKINSKQAINTIVDLDKMASAFRKIGFNKQQANAMATGFNDTISDVKNEILDLQAGLMPNTDTMHKLTEALGTALNPKKIMDMMAPGSTAGPKEIFDEIQKEVATLDAKQKPLVMRRLMRILPPDLAASLDPLAEGYKKAGDAAVKNDKKLGTASQEYGKLETAMKNTLLYQGNLTEAAKNFNEITKVLANKGKYIKSLKDQAKVWDALTASVNESGNKLGIFQKILQGIKDIGLGFLFPEAGVAGTFAGALGSMLVPLGSFLGILQIIKGPIAYLGKGFLWLLKPVGMLIPRLASIGTIFSGMGAWMSAAAMAVIPWVIGIAAIGAAVYALYKCWTPFTKTVDSFFDSFGDTFKQIGHLVKDLIFDFSNTYGHIGERLSGIGASIVKGWKKWTRILVPIWDEQVEKFMAGWHVFTGGLAKGWAYVGHLWDVAMEGLSNVWTGFTGFLGKAWDKSISYVGGGWAKFTGFFKDGFTTAYNYVADKLTKFSDFFSNIGLTLSATWASVTTMLSSGLDSAWSTIINKASGAVKTLTDTFSSIRDRIASVFSGMAQLFKDPFATLGAAFENAKSTIASGMKNMFGGIFDSLPDFILNFLKGGGPIGMLMQGGKGLVSGIKGLFSDSGPSVGSSPAAAMAATIPSQVASQSMPSSAAAPSSAPSAQPTNYQPSAPSMSPMAGADLKPTVVPQLNDQNFQVVAQGLADMKDTLAQLLSQLINKPVNVILQGDVKGLLRVAGRQAASDAGAMGMNAAYGK